jgi:RecA-family ATPase
LATAGSQGGLFLGEFPCTQGDVLCLSLEDNERRLAKRLKMQLQGEPAPRNARLATKLPMFRETKKNEIDGLGYLHQFIEEHPETRLVIIDTLAKVRQRRKKEGNLYGQDYEDLEQLQQMASLYGIAIVLVHHLNKGQHQDEFNTISGSTGLSGCADTIAILRKPRGATEGELFISGRDVEEIRGALSFDPDTGLWTWNGTVAEAKSSQEREEIFEVMKSVGLPMKPKDVHEKLGGTRTLNAIQQAMIRMRASGSLESSARGKGW